ncbi:MAG: hypothetical protein A2Y28_03125 [Chlamydiae bacterium GWC2_50_10]|nr:MAG: hypothetical protein A2Z85_01565 [Chlamydiae bacterium GWA2_50_15]OGN54253.1 MAG: hypothetical protein A2Y28_03125 [Chlamydiae bacterium GWC2_50_10]OGN58775.1 MAG: hypothetical protein A3D18_06115 [Chlamydiae bacterium RIFCSPHIGHO2_02_FULL_49_29]OGN63241.1 MAG: hypothetical protein A3E26_04905 [Chlamydiae bacterium RIFCSPHIGHO2_12_FULL_49_32]OGN68383.1 MAG: hypothetical protein A3I15_04355 [Chlamydiae bacterium RIFCSPLOWO2_02_FULL_49_12]OGN73758.1 MAG: hypothetical protein A3G30_05865 
MSKIYHFFLTFLWGSIPLLASSSSHLFSPPQPSLLIQNRILAHINEKTITVLDLMQAMTLFLSKSYPDQAKSPLARSHFYIEHWNEFLEQMIDQELILADAKTLDLKISDKDIRETLLERFGPNVMQTLEKLGLAYEKAKELLYNEIVLERMTWYRVHTKAYEKVSPQHIKFAYKEYLATNPPTKTLEYQVLSIRCNEHEAAQKIGQTAYHLLSQHEADFSTICEKLPRSEEVSVSLSDIFSLQESELSPAHKEALSSLAAGSFSSPITQVSRFDNSNVVRIFFLKSQTKSKPLEFKEIEQKLREKLFNEAVSSGRTQYIAKLRQQYRFNSKSPESLIPEDFKPFSLR